MLDSEISVLLATYNPRIDWLKEQLLSIKKQTYTDYELLIYDDCSEIEIFQEIENVVKNIFDETQIRLYRGEHNLGSNTAFEYLSRIAHGKYLAFCDQDDIWKKDKLEKLLIALQSGRDVTIAYSDMAVIDSDGRLICDTLRKYRKSLRYIQGFDKASYYVIDNCTAGCSMLVKKECVLAAMPFFQGTVCDQWIAIYAASNGNVAFIDEPLVSYRRHDNNQTASLGGIECKKDYYQKRVQWSYEILRELDRRNLRFKRQQELREFAQARKEKRISKIIKYRYFSPKYAKFDVVVKLCPEWVLKKLIWK